MSNGTNLRRVEMTTGPARLPIPEFGSQKTERSNSASETRVSALASGLASALAKAFALALASATEWAPASATAFAFASVLATATSKADSQKVSEVKVLVAEEAAASAANPSSNSERMSSN